MGQGFFKQKPWIYFFATMSLTDWQLSPCSKTKLQMIISWSCDNSVILLYMSNVPAQCGEFIRCEDGEAKISCGYKLPARYVISTVGPMGEHPKVPKMFSNWQLCVLLNRCWKTPTWTAWKWWKKTIWDLLPFPAYPPASMAILTWVFSPHKSSF